MYGCQDYDSTLEKNYIRSATNSPCMIAKYNRVSFFDGFFLRLNAYKCVAARIMIQSWKKMTFARRQTLLVWSQSTIGSRFATVSFYDVSLLPHMSSRTEHSRLVVHLCRNSSVLSLLNALLAILRCTCISSYSILVQFFEVDGDFNFCVSMHHYIWVY